jgi:signal transduction histidine kinase
MRARRVLLAALAFCGAQLACAAEPPTRHTQAEFVLSPDPAHAPEQAPWQRVLLPDQWKAAAGASTGWYRLTFRVDDPGTEPWLVYLPRLREGGVLYVNGQVLAKVPEPDAGTWVRWMRPHAFAIPPSQLRRGDNTLHLRVNAANRDRIVSSIHIGPDGSVRPLYESRFFLTYTLAQIISTVMIVTALFVLAVWWRRRMDFDYGLFGLGALFWGVHTLNYVIETLPEPYWLYWRTLRYAATGGFAIAITLFVLRSAGIRRKGFTRLFTAYWLSGPLVLLLGGARWHGFVDRYYQGGLLLIGVVMIFAALYAVWRQRTAGSVALCLAVLLGVGAAAHDFMLSQGVVVDPEGPYLLYFAATALLLVVGAQLADRFVTSLREAEQAAAARERAIADERQRIMQDMHDGLGSQLLTSLALAERGALDGPGMAQLLRESIDDMRLAIDTLSPGKDGLLEALGNLRYRLEPRFRAAGIELRFQAHDLPDRLTVPPEAALQILRVLQESLTNVLKHARARTVRVLAAIEHAPERFLLEVSDDGAGFDPAAAPAGRGLAGMQRRGERIGATVSVTSGSGGSRVRIVYPLPG